jgi:hypothetical protein
VVRERGIDASFIPSGQGGRENRNDAPTEGDDVTNVDRIDLRDRGSGAGCWLTIIVPTPLFFVCVAGEGLAGDKFACVAAKRVTGAFLVCVATKELRANCREANPEQANSGG